MESGENGKNTSRRFKRLLTAVAAAAVFLLIAVLTAFAGKESYLLLSALVMLISCVPFFIGFEAKKTGAGEISVIAVMTALSVVGRLIFAPLPGFKPVSAIVILTGIAFGPEAGFISGSTSALVSNIFFGQGPWTPFQMFSWGIIGFISGISARNRKNPSVFLLTAMGIVGGVIFSMLMDIWTTFAFSGTFTFGAYFGYVASSLYFMIKYAVSNVIFLIILGKPLSVKFTRLKMKYGLFEKYI